MKKLVKYMCVLAIAAIATIVIMYNMASADNEVETGAQPTFFAELAEVNNDGSATINVWFEFDEGVESVTSAAISVSTPKGIQWTNQPANGIYERNLKSGDKIQLIFTGFSNVEEDVTLNISVGEGWKYTKKGDVNAAEGTAVTAKVIVEKQNPGENPGEDPDNPGENPGDNPDNPGENPGDNPENPGEDPDNPGDNPENPGEDPDNPGEDPGNPGEDPGNPGEDPENPGEDPGENPGEDPENPGENPGNNPTQPPVDNDPPKIGPDIMKLSVGDVSTYGADKKVTWSSSNNSVAIINKTTGQVTAVGEGKATITATAENGQTATAQIIVERKSSGGNEAANPVIFPSSDFTINAGDTYQLNADMEVEWKSLDETVATVDANGLVKGVGEGNTIIYARSKDLRASNIGVTVKGTSAKGNTGNTGSNGGTKTNKTGNATTGDGNSSSTVNEEVPSTGETSTGTIVILGAVTLIVAAVVFRKKMK